MSNQTVCLGCMLQPGFLFPMPCQWCRPVEYTFPKVYVTHHQGLTDEEKMVLNSLKEAWEKFINLGSHVDHDLTEFNYAIHLAQQKLAVRVARRVDTDVWRQPEEAGA